MLAAAWSPRLISGGYDNALMPAYAGICILFGIGIHGVIEYAQRWPATDRVVVGSCVYCLCILQFGALFYNPFTQIPTPRDLKAGRALVGKLAQIPGRIFMPAHSGCYVPELMERCGSAHQVAIADILVFGSEEARTALVTDYSRAITEMRFDAILLDSGSAPFLAEVEKYYVRQKLDLGSSNALWPVTGHRTRPALMFVPRTSRTER
jgi:hypothetical protein